MVQTSKINANGIEIGVIGGTEPDNSYISLTDIAKYKNSEDPRMVITNWMSSYSTIDFLAVWEEIHNSDDFNRL
ncbi:MAG: KilA-N domain-containing protein [Butyrivibrio sp.]|nr:KilA-N domain-containing protein [Butyrivibrio sp.]